MIQSIVKSRVYHLSLYLSFITFYEKSVLTYMPIFIAFEHNINRFWKRTNTNGVQAMSILFKHKSILIAFERKVTLIAFEHNPILIAFEQKTILISYEHIQTQINIISIWAQIDIGHILIQFFFIVRSFFDSSETIFAKIADVSKNKEFATPRSKHIGKSELWTHGYCTSTTPTQFPLRL